MKPLPGMTAAFTFPNGNISKVNVEFPEPDKAKIEFTFLTGDVNWEDYGGKFVAGPFNNGDWPYFFVMEVFPWSDAGDNAEKEMGKYNVCLSVVSPRAARKVLASALESCGGDLTGLNRKQKMLAKVEALHSYGTKAVMVSINGDDLNSMMEKVKEEAFKVNHLFGFYMDRDQNAFGNTGWDFVKGQIG